MRTLRFCTFILSTTTAAAVLAACGVLPGQPAASFSARLKPNTSSSEKIFEYTGHKRSFTVPAGVTSLTITANGAYGAAGGPRYTYIQSQGGMGGTVTAMIPVTPGEHLAIFVGGSGAISGFNGGGPGGYSFYGGGGGGASDVRQGGDRLSDRVIVAGGGGGGGGDATGSSDYVGGDGGAGGGITGAPGLSGGYGSELGGGGGTGGSQTKGGKGGAGGGRGCGGVHGRLGHGGAARLYETGKCGAHGGGGGGGYYGGGGGGAGGYDSSDDFGAGGGGGGGSSFAEQQATRVKITDGASGDSARGFGVRPAGKHDGEIIITW